MRKGWFCYELCVPQLPKVTEIADGRVFPYDFHYFKYICRQMGVSLMPYSPLAAGHLLRAVWQSDSLRGQMDRVARGKYDRMEQQDMRIVERIHELAKKYGCKMSQIALAWQWAKGVASPIIGAIDKNPEQGVILLDEKK